MLSVSTAFLLTRWLVTRWHTTTLFFFLLNGMVRAVVPRYRYDQLMRLGWKVFLPTSLVAVALIGAFRVFWLPS